MKNVFSEKIRELAEKSPSPLYAVGGFVRDYLIDKSISKDVDLCSPMSSEEFVGVVKSCGIDLLAEYKRTGTVMFALDNVKYEFTSFRTEKYHGGEHTPYMVAPTFDIKEDALRRDFKCNAIYYDINNDKIIDPLGGVNDVKNKILSTVKDANQVFSNDGLRLMRLARFSGELGFRVEEQTLNGALNNAYNIDDISKERIYEELNKILTADFAHNFSPKDGHYKALKVLDKIGVLDRIIPELTLGRGMKQRADFHDYDVLEHCMRSVLYANKHVRFASLLHDVGKPYCKIHYGAYRKHNIEGERIAMEILKRLKAPKKDIDLYSKLVRFHMVDLDCSLNEKHIRRFIVKTGELFPLLMQLKQADFSACKDNLKKSPTVEKWENVYGQMVREKTPFTVKNLNVDANTLKKIGYSGYQIGKELNRLWVYAIDNPKLNEKDALQGLAIRDFTH